MRERLRPVVIGPVVIGPVVLGPVVLGPVVLGPVVLGPVVLLGRLHGEQLTGPGEVPGAPAVGEEAVMADAVETRGQDMEEEAADEFGKWYCIT